MHFKTKDRD